MNEIIDNQSDLEKDTKAEEEVSRSKNLERVEMPPQLEALVEGPVISILKSSVFIDLSPFGTGIIYGREFINARELIRKINIGDRRNYLLAIMPVRKLWSLVTSTKRVKPNQLL